MDFVIVGGGIYGCGVAWELARRGGEVLLLEAATVAGGASGGKGKRGVRANGRDLRELPLMRLAYPRWPDLRGTGVLPGGVGCARMRTRSRFQRPFGRSQNGRPASRARSTSEIPRSDSRSTGIAASALRSRMTRKAVRTRFQTVPPVRDARLVEKDEVCMALSIMICYVSVSGISPVDQLGVPG